jgi:ribonuclease-3
MKHAALCRQLGHRFSQSQLLQRALTHRSHSAAHNERLEFLGDSLLDCALSRYLYDTFPELPEGDLSRLRANLVNQQTLATLARQLKLGDCLQLGEGELRSGGGTRPSILADALEALFGAVWLDAGFEAAQRVVLSLYAPYIAATDLVSLGKDPKTLLQEFLQGRKLSLPQYGIVEIRGEAHAQIFVVSCDIPKLQVSTRGEGGTRRLAEQAAAEKAYQLIKNTP